MSLIVNGTEIENINVIDKDGNLIELETLRTSDGVVVWERFIEDASPDEMFNWVAFDENDKNEYQIGFTTPVYYGVGEVAYTYYKLIEPTPTTEAEVLGKYYQSGATYTKITSSNISNITLGTTEIFDEVSTKEEATHESTGTPDTNNGLNDDYFGFNVSSTTDEDSPNSAPDLGITEIIIPSKHNGLPVKRILRGAFWGYSVDSQDHEYFYPTWRISTLKLGSNIEVIEGRSIVTMCRNSKEYPYQYNYTNGLILNSKLKEIESESIVGTYSSSYDLVLPPSVSSVAGDFSSMIATRMPTPILNSLTITTNGAFKESTLANPLYGLGDPKVTKVLIIKNTVTSFSGALVTTSTNGIIVFEHSADDELSLDILKPKSASTCTIYTDHPVVQNYDWAGANITATILPLSDYIGVS